MYMYKVCQYTQILRIIHTNYLKSINNPVYTIYMQRKQYTAFNKHDQLFEH